MTPPASKSNRRRFDQIAGGVLALIGVAAAVVAVVALHRPTGRALAAAKQSVVVDSAANESDSNATAGPTSPASTAGASAPATSASAAATSASASASSSTAGATKSSDAKSVPLVVLNNTTLNGLGSTARGRFVAGGWTVTSVGNLTNDIASTCAYYDPSNPSNQLAAQALQAQFPAIKRVKERFDGLPSAPIVVVLTPDYS